MILELDCGNSFIKWRVLPRAGLGSALASGVADGVDELIAALADRFAGQLSVCRLVSVRGDDETLSLIHI